MTMRVSDLIENLTLMGIHPLYAVFDKKDIVCKDSLFTASEDELRHSPYYNKKVSLFEMRVIHSPEDGTTGKVVIWVD